MSADPATTLPIYVLDSFAMLSYLENEAGVERVKVILKTAAQKNAAVYITLISLGEVLYITEREQGLALAQKVLSAIEQLPVTLLEASKERILAAAHIKAQYPIAYADAFVVAAAQEYGGTVVTGDPEFVAVEKVVAVEWLPKT